MNEKEIKKYLEKNLKFGYVVDGHVGFITLELEGKTIDKFPIERY